MAEPHSLYSDNQNKHKQMSAGLHIVAIVQQIESEEDREDHEHIISFVDESREMG